MIVEIDGQQYDVPDDTTDEELNALFPAPAAAPAEGWGGWLARQGRGMTESLNRVSTRALTGPVDLPLAIGDALRNALAGKIPGVTPSQGHSVGNAWLDATNTPRQAATAGGRFVEGMGTAALSGGMAGTSGVIGNVARLAGMEAAGEAGQAAGQKVGGDLGAILGAVATPGAVPALARAAQYGGMKLAAPALQRSENAPLTSGQIYDALARQGIQPTAGLVGNQTAARLEKSISEVPFLGSRLRTMANEQKTQFDNAVNRAGDAIQGDGPPVAPDIQSIGGTVQGAAGAAATRRLNEFGQERTGIINDAGPDLPIGVGGTFNRAGELRRKDGASIAAGLDRIKGLLRADATRTAGPNGPAIEVPLSQLLGTRDAVGRATSGERTLPKGAEKQVYGALTDDVKSAMDRVDPELSSRWTDFNSRYSTAMNRVLTPESGDLRFMRDLAEMPTADRAQRAVFGNKNNPVPMEALRENAPGPYQGAAAGQFLMEAQPTNGGRTGYSEFSPNTLLTNMSARERGGTLQPLVGDQAPRVYDLMDIAQAFRDAGRQENASGTAGTAFIQYALTNPAAVLANLPQGVLASIFAGGLVTKPEFAQAIAGRSQGLVPYVDLPRAARTGYAGGQGALADLYASAP